MKEFLKCGISECFLGSKFCLVFWNQFSCAISMEQLSLVDIRNSTVCVDLCTIFHPLATNCTSPSFSSRPINMHCCFISGRSTFAWRGNFDFLRDFFQSKVKEVPLSQTHQSSRPEVIPVYTQSETNISQTPNMKLLENPNLDAMGNALTIETGDCKLSGR